MIATRTVINMAIVAIVVGVIVGIGGWYAGVSSVPPAKAVTTTITKTVSGAPVTSTITKTMAAPGLKGEITFGGLFPLTGPISAFAKEMLLAGEFGVSDVNAFLSSAGIPVKIKLVAEDTELKPEVGLEKFKGFVAKGIKVTVGWVSSPVLMHGMSYGNNNHIVMISASSTAPSLAIPGDYVFRVCPDDNKQGTAIARVMYDQGIRYVIPVWRGNTWGDGLKAATQKRFEELGGTYLKGIRYSPGAKEFSAEVSSLASLVKDAINRYGADKVAVHYIGFQEAAVLFSQASEYPVLTKVRWYGSDGTALNKAIVGKSTAAKFAIETKHIAPYYAPTESKSYMRVKDYLAKHGYYEPVPYSFNTYDSVLLATKSMLIAGKYDGEAIKKVLPYVAETTWGSSGWLKLNAAGDRDMADYLFYTVTYKNGKYIWIRAGYYSAAADKYTSYLKP